MNINFGGNLAEVLATNVSVVVVLDVKEDMAVVTVRATIVFCLL